MGASGKPKSALKSSTLGKSIIRNRFQGNRPKDGDTNLIHTSDLHDGHSWTNLQSITQEADIQDILHTAELAGNQFTAEKLNISIINPFSAAAAPATSLSRQQEHSVFIQHLDMLRIPRRPSWHPSTSTKELHQQEQLSFLNWRRNLAQFQQHNQLLITPYERNLEVWRQLWRVIERCQLIVQIVDARNPLFFYCLDLNKYVQESGNGSKRHLLLVNKADMLTSDQRLLWANYFIENQIQFCFFSAELAKRMMNDDQDLIDRDHDNNNILLHDLEDIHMDNMTSDSMHALYHHQSCLDDEMVVQVDPTHILSPADLIDLFKAFCPKFDTVNNNNSARMTIGLVGFPNVGKSSTINALLRSNKCSVSSTPGKTKHFQTLILTDDLMLCDCPGLVFPSFATTTADMVCNGVLPIDQLRDSSAPSSLVALRVPKELIERIYGIRIKLYNNIVNTFSSDPLLDREVPTGPELCMAYALARGFMRQGQGNPDESRAARYILKDYVSGKLGYVHPPPNYERSESEFNAQLHSRLLSLCKKKPFTPLQSKSNNDNNGSSTSNNGKLHQVRSDAVDQEFFSSMERVGVKTKGKFAVQDYRRTEMGVGVRVHTDGGENGGAAKKSSNNHHKKMHKSGKKNHKHRVPVRDE